MNAALWPALRELIQAEAQLAVLRGLRRGRVREHEAKDIAHLEAQVTRMETAVREGLQQSSEVSGSKP